MDKAKLISAKQARYIKLGTTGIWEKSALEQGIMPVYFSKGTHALGLSNDFEGAKKLYLSEGKSPSTAADQARQLLDFYQLGRDTLWITFANGDLWWCFAEPDVILDANGVNRHRKVIGQWRNTSISGKPLHMVELNGNLTKTAGYRSAICRIYPDQFDYLIRKINDAERPVVVEAQRARGSMIGSIVALMQELQPNDFEVLVDLVFSQSGWRRLGAVGKTQKTVDMEIELPSTGERAFIQVKSHTKQAELDRYVEAFEERIENRMFYIYHSARYGVHTQHPRVSLIGPEKLAEMVLNAGLFDWLLQKAG